MSRLMAANLMKLKKDVVFWIAIISMVGFEVFVMVKCYYNLRGTEVDGGPDDFLFGFTLLISILAAVFVSLHVGTEYSDGTIRNKLIVGHTRTHVYCAQFLECLIGAYLMIAIYMVVATVLGCILFGAFTLSISELLLMTVGTLLMAAALIAIYTLIGMLISSRAVSAVISILAIFILIFVAVYLNSGLNEPETYNNYVYNEETQLIEEEKNIPNSYYIGGKKRVVYETLLDILPSGQAVQYSAMVKEDLLVRPLYSLIIIVLANGAGIVIFKRKDIK